jgi:copper chaperone CopZ
VEEHAILFIPLTVPAGTAQRKLHTLPGINEISVNHLTHTVRVSYDPTKITSDKIRHLLKSLAAPSSLIHGEASRDQTN